VSVRLTEFRRRKLLALFGAAAFASCKRSVTRVIGVVPQGRTHMFWLTIQAGAMAAAREKGVEISWNAPLNETDYNGQIQIVESMINRHVDAIAVAPIDRNAMVSVVERAAASGIPVIIFDTAVQTEVFTAQISTDNYAAGKMAAARLGQVLNGKGSIVIVGSQPGAASSVAREKGFEEKMAADFPDIKILDKRFGMADFAKSLAVTENMLTAYPRLDGLFASNESSSVGASQAIKSRNARLVMVGFDTSPTLLDDLKNGVIDALVAQNPFKIGYEAVAAAVKKLNGGNPEKIQSLSARLVTRNNLNDPEISALIHPDLKKYLGR
jgi:ribose transport system substrate-binding protein